MLSGNRERENQLPCSDEMCSITGHIDGDLPFQRGRCNDMDAQAPAKILENKGLPPQVYLQNRLRLHDSRLEKVFFFGMQVSIPKFQ
jgi:hypothetical protein